MLLVKGPAGSGKTRLTYHLPDHVIGVDFQLHSSESWTTSVGQADLASQILRYASTDAGPDPLLRLERECVLLRRPTVVVLDAPAVTTGHPEPGAVEPRVAHPRGGQEIATTPCVLSMTVAPSGIWEWSLPAGQYPNTGSVCRPSRSQARICSTMAVAARSPSRP